MLRWLLIAAVVYLAWRLLGRLLLRRRPGPGNPDGRGPDAMVRCAHCGVHVPASRAILEGDDWYCCPGHRDEARR